MKTRIFLVLIIAGVLAPHLAIAQIDFSPLEKWRNWRPPQEWLQRPNTRQEPAPNPQPAQISPEEAAREEKAQKKYEQSLAKKVQSSWIPVSPTAAVTEPSRWVPVSPGNRSLGIRPSDPKGFLAPLGKAMDGSPEAQEDLRRSVAILAAAAQSGPQPGEDMRYAGSAEDMAFLAGQAALAMEGAPLEVIVGPSNIQPGQQAAIDHAMKDIGVQKAVLDQAGQDRDAAIKQYMDLKKSGSPEQIAAEKPGIIAKLRKASQAIEQAKSDTGADVYILLPPK